MKKTSKLEKNRFYQAVVIELSDGKLIRFTGPAELYPGDMRRITNIRFTEPMKLDNDYSWGTINE